jgi:hypothetical protein
MTTQFKLAKKAQTAFVSPFNPRRNQQEYFVDNPINQLKLNYAGTDTRSIVLNAPTGSGKTTSAILGLIPEWVRQFYPEGKSVIGFMTHFSEVVDATAIAARKHLDNKAVQTSAGAARIRVYDSEDLKYHASRKQSLDGDVVVILITASFFTSRIESFATENGNKFFDFILVDEGHFRFGTISAEDTKADKGATNNNFVAVTLTQLRERIGCATLFMTATPTNSQQALTPLGASNNIFLPQFPNDKDTRPAYQFLEYPSNDLTVEEGIAFYGTTLALEKHIHKQISDDTWNLIKEKFPKTHSISMNRLARRGALNGVDFAENIERIEDLEAEANSYALTSTSKRKTFNGNKIRSLDEGIRLTHKYNNAGISINVIDSGYAGLDQPRIKNVIVGREPSGTIANNYIQIAGRAARMMFFATHSEAVEYIKNLPISDDQKRWVAEYYLVLNIATIHIPMESELLSVDVRDEYENTTYRPDQLRAIVLQGIFEDGLVPGGMRLSTSTTLQNEVYKQFQKEDCEVCCKSDGVHADCFMLAWKSMNAYYGRTLTEEEAKEDWFKTLNIHHKDGNHFNNESSNLVTICPNVHQMITMVEEHYNNRYGDLDIKA